MSRLKSFDSVHLCFVCSDLRVHTKRMEVTISRIKDQVHKKPILISYALHCHLVTDKYSTAMCYPPPQCLTRGTFWPNLNSVKNVFFLFIWLILGILLIVLAKKTFNFNFFEKYGQFKLLIAKKDVKCKIKIGTLQN